MQQRVDPHTISSAKVRFKWAFDQWTANVKSEENHKFKEASTQYANNDERKKNNQ